MLSISFPAPLPLPAIAETQSLNKNLNFASALGPIEARQFFKIQAQPEPKNPSPIDDSATVYKISIVQ